MSNEFSESAKAVQEVAKTVKTGVEATEKLGRFVSRVTSESVEAVTGMLSDRLRFIRWERQLRLRDRILEIIQERGIEERFNIIQPKLVLPIIENASLEEHDELQDLWAYLLASALDPNFKGEVRTAFIDILKQLEVTDIHILNAIYEERATADDKDLDAFANFLWKHLVTPTQITNKLDIGLDVYENSIDNLLRVRLVSSNVAFERYSQKDGYAGSRGDLLNHADYDFVCLTPLGAHFIEACTNQHRRES